MGRFRRDSLVANALQFPWPQVARPGTGVHQRHLSSCTILFLDTARHKAPSCDSVVLVWRIGRILSPTRAGLDQTA
jgi:hypothetical protein